MIPTRQEVAPQTEPSGVPRSSWVLLGCAWLLAFAMFAPILSLPPIEHIITVELSLTHAQTGLLFSLPIAILAAIAIPSGLLADRIGVRKAAGIGAITIAGGSLLRGTATTSGAIFGFTSLFGVGFALIYPNLPKLIGAWFPRERAGLVTGIYTTGIALGCTLPLTITLPLVFPVTNSIQGVFYIWSIPAIAATILWWMSAREPSPSSTQPKTLGNVTKSSFGVFWNRDLWLVALMLFATCFHFYIWAGWAPALMMLKGASPEMAAFIASVRGWVGLPVIFLMPWASYKVGLRKPFLWASALVLALASYAAIYITVPLGWLLMVVIGIPVAGTFSMILALPVELVPKDSVGVASGVMLSVGYIGGLIGPWLAGYLFDITSNLNLALLMLTAVAIAWAFIAFLIPETGPKGRQKKTDVTL